jgi:glycosyltransferase involved in cell wall biosynthesis
MLRVQPHVPSIAEARAALDPHPAFEGGWRLDPDEAARRGRAGGGPLVSIVTVTFNAEKVLGETLDSVRRQTYRNIEHIVVDGGSHDGTVDVIRANADHVAYWRSEPDRGIYDAFNKGVALARGEYVGILNADDFFEPDQIEKAVAAIEGTGAPFVHGNITLHGWQGRDVEIHGDPNYELIIAERMPSLNHASVLCRLSVFEMHGLFVRRYRIAGDYDWYLRLARSGCIGRHVPAVHAHMRAGGISTTHQRLALFEAFLITWRHGLPLGRALRRSGRLAAFPNGVPRNVSRAVKTIRNPISALRALVRRWNAMPGGRFEQIERTPLANAFVDARHLTKTIDAPGLEWLYEAGTRAGTFVCDATGPEAEASRLLLRGSGAHEVDKRRHADIVILASTPVRKKLGLLKSRKATIIILGEEAPVGEVLPARRFAGFTAVGYLVNVINHPENGAA